jgi:SAM-dependent methyltransferase
VIRAAVKAAGLLALGRLPGGPTLYRELTRNVWGTQATHVDKLQRVWPIYVQVWQQRCGLRLEGLRVWVHEAGWTPFPALVSYLLTGSGGVLTNTAGGGRLLDRYLARAVNGALATELPAELVPAERRLRVEALRWHASAREAVAGLDARLVEGCGAGAIPLEAASVDLVHSGGALEHYPADRLRAFLDECQRILRPGGVASHVFDHRDHLHHADRSWPFLGHLALPEPLYRALFGHPLGYHNRLSPTEVMAIFDEAGFQRVAVRRLVLPHHRYADREAELADARPGLGRPLLARRHRAISAVDLRTAAAHYLYSKPLTA